MKSDKTATANGNAHVPGKDDNARTAALEAFDAALKGNDYFEAAKAIGVLEFVGQADIDYFCGMMYRTMALELMEGSMDACYVAADPRVKEHLDTALEHFSKVPEGSEFHSESMEHIEAAYRVLGDYEALDALLKQRGSSLSPIEEMSKRVECLSSLALINPLDEATFPAEVATPPIDSIDESAAQQLAKYQVLASFADALAMVSECVYQCAEYARNVPGCDAKFAEHEETASYASMYDECVRILRCSNLFKNTLLPEAMDDLPHLALSDRTWSQRIDRSSDEWWAESLARACWQLCAPEAHPQVDPYQCVERILQNYMLLGRFNLGPVISRYFSTIADAAEGGNESAQAYLGFAYSMIKINGDDPHDLEKKLERYAQGPDGGFKDFVTQHAWLSTALSPHSFDALVNSEFALLLHESAEVAERDASHIALMFFRVLEYEYSDNLLHPLIAAIDFDQLEQATGYVEHSKRRRDGRVIARRYDRWLRGLDSLYAVKTGFKTAMEIGVLRTFLVHTLHWDDPCALLLKEALESVLTEDGLEAFHTEKLMDVIGRTQVNEYRIPGAHTGFVSLTKAKEARDYVTAWAPVVTTWFKASGNSDR